MSKTIRLLSIVFALALVILVSALNPFFARSVSAQSGDVPFLNTDKLDYRPEESVIITGGGFTPGMTYDIVIIRPDGSIVKGDGTFMSGWDTVGPLATDELAYVYKLNGITGIYEVRAYPSPWSGDRSEEALVTITFTDCHFIITKVPDAATVNAGQQIGFTITVKTDSGSMANARLKDPLPAGPNWQISPAVSECSISNGVLSCAWSSVGTTPKTVHVIAQTTAADCGYVDNTATVYTSDGANYKAAYGRIKVICPGDLKVLKYNDLNSSGSQDVGEPGLTNWTMTLKNSSGAIVGTQQTGSDGWTTFSSITPGNYTVCETLQNGWTNTDPVGGSGCKNVSVAPTVISDAVTTSLTVIDIANTVTYKIEFLGVQNGVTWSYKVSETSGKNLNYWVLGLCTPKPKSWSPTGGVSPYGAVEFPAPDTNTGVSGIKWNTLSAFTNGVFSITYDTVYPVGSTSVGVKGSYGGMIAVGNIAGPDCGTATTPEIKLGNVQQPQNGSLEVTKVVNWNGYPADNTQTFSVCVTGASYPSNCKSVGYNGGTVTWSNLPVGNYTVSEGSLGSLWEAPVYVPSNGVVAVPVGGKGTATVTNKHVQYTKLTLSTFCSDNPAVSLNWKVTNPNSYAVTFTWRIEGTSQTGSQTVPANSSVNLTTNAEGTNTMTVLVNGEQQAQLQNPGEACTGGLEVIKVVNWNGYDVVPTQTFEICIEGPYLHPVSYVNECKLVSAPDWKATWTNLEVGEYLVTEKDPGSEWVVSGSGINVNVEANAPAKQVTITNTRLLSSLTVTKVIQFAGAPIPTVSFTICADGPKAGAVDKSCKLFSPTNLVQTWTDLPGGEYIITEEGVDTNVWTVTLPNFGMVTVPLNGGNARYTVTNYENPPSSAIGLKYFRVEGVYGNRVILAWTTFWEANNVGFKIYRSNSADLKTAVEVGWVVTQGNGDTEKVYRYEDTTPGTGLYYYWLVDVQEEGGQMVSRTYDPVMAPVGFAFYIPLMSR